MSYLVHIHSILRWWVLALAIVAIFKAFQGMQQKSVFSSTDNKVGFFLVLVCDLQLLIGLILYFMGPWGLKNIQNMGMGEAMKNAYSRFFAVEHITMMIVAIILIHIGRARSQKAIADVVKHKNAFWYYLIALVLILASIPWPFKQGFEALGWI